MTQQNDLSEDAIEMYCQDVFSAMGELSNGQKINILITVLAALIKTAPRDIQFAEVLACSTALIEAVQ